MNIKIFISKSKKFLSVIDLLKTKEIDYELFDILSDSIIDIFSLYFIDYDRISENELNILKNANCFDKVYFLISEEKTNDIIQLLKQGFKNIFFDINDFNNFIDDFSNIKSLKFNNKILSEIIDNANESIVITNTNGDILYVNNKFIQLTGYTFDEAIGENPRILKTDYHEDKFYEDLWKTISSGKVCECEFKNKSKDGTFYWELARISPIFNNTGQIQYYFAVKKDITDEKEIKQNFETHKELISSIQNFSIDFFYIKDAENRWVFANKNLCDVLGISQTDYINKTDVELSKIITKNKPAFEKCLFYSNIAWNKGKKITFNIEVEDDNKKIVINMAKNPIYFIDGKRKAIVTIGRNITDLNNLQNKLEIEKEKSENANKLKSIFISNVSHDLRSPLNSIIGFSNILLKDKTLHRGAVKYINIIKESSVNILEMLNDILDITKLENNKISIKKTNILVYLLLMEIFEQNILQAQEKHLELSLDYKIDKKFQILSDELRIKQIITNLVTNAIKYTQKGYVKISCNIDKGNLIISVKDSGAGIPKDKQKYIFERFYQIERSNERQLKGAGLGLSISKLLSEKLGGSLSFKSTENESSEFYFKLPLPNVNIAELKNTKNNIETKAIDIKNKNILIVDDSESSVLLYKTILEDANLFVAVDGLEAVKKAKEIKNLNLILMDIQLPKLSGIEAIKEIRKFNNDIIIISQTANAMVGDKEKCLFVGSNDYITKPIDENDLFDMIGKYFS